MCWERIKQKTGSRKIKRLQFKTLMAQNSPMEMSVNSPLIGVGCLNI